VHNQFFIFLTVEKDLSHVLEEIGIVSNKDKKVYKFGYTFKSTTDFTSSKSKFNFVHVRQFFATNISE